MWMPVQRQSGESDGAGLLLVLFSSVFFFSLFYFRGNYARFYIKKMFSP